MAYTESLWEEELTLQSKNHIISGPDGGSIATVYENRPRHDAKENAKRIVACVNACAGITTEALNKGIVKGCIEGMRRYNHNMDKIANWMGVPVYEEEKISINKENYECGCCEYWMTDDCPKERLCKDGRKRGPHDSAIPCDKFEQKPYYQKKKPDEMEESK